MDIVTNGLLMLSAALFTIAAVHFRMCFDRSSGPRHRFFVAAAMSFAFYALFERAMMLAETPAEYGSLGRWVHVVIWFGLVSTALFVRSYLGSNREWLFWSVIILRSLAVVINFATPVNLNYLEITSISKVPVLREMVSIAVGVPNPLMIVGQTSSLLLIIYCIDAAIRTFRLGHRQRALTIGGSFVIFSITNFFAPVMSFWGVIEWPLFASPGFLGILGAMGFELSRDIQLSAQLADDLARSEADLRESARQLDLSADAANVGIWTRKVGEKEIVASRKWNELFGFETSHVVTVQEFRSRIHPDDLEQVLRHSNAMEQGGGGFDYQYRIVLPSGETRWMASTGKVDLVDGKAVRLRGASVDITKRKLAEEDAHELSRRLMSAQEKERARIARELHDDLSQSLALLSINLQGVSVEPAEPRVVKEKVNQLSLQIQRLSSDVHRISHELHPAKLEQLGLESALRGFCREVAATHGLKIEFNAAEVSRSLPNDVSLCLYRVAQESLQNIVKHSGASVVNVKLDQHEAEISLTVTDNGSGFDPESVRAKESLGLVSMSERIGAVSGAITIDSSVGSGSQIIARVPHRVSQVMNA